MTDASRRRRSLGRGLAALLGDEAVVAATAPGDAAGTALPEQLAAGASAGSATAAASGATMLPITALRSGRLQPRRSFDEAVRRLTRG